MKAKFCYLFACKIRQTNVEIDLKSLCAASKTQLKGKVVLRVKNIAQRTFLEQQYELFKRNKQEQAKLDSLIKVKEL